MALALAEAVQGIGSEWLPRLESAARVVPNDPAVAAAIGAAMMERQLWGKARRPLEQAATAGSLSAEARRHAWRRLAELAQQEGDNERARQCEQAAARID